MRLNSKEVSAIQKAFMTVFPQEKFHLFLFGSRADDQKKGGDIDLLVIVDKLQKTEFVAKKSQVKLHIFENIDEQKIDITVATEEEMKTDAFLMSIRESLVKL